MEEIKKNKQIMYEQAKKPKEKIVVKLIDKNGKETKIDI